MPLPSTAPSKCPVITMTTVGDTYLYPVYVQTIRWDLTTAATSTWCIKLTQSTAVGPNADSTYAWPLIGTSTQAVFVGGYSTAGNFGLQPMQFTINNWCWGLVLTSFDGGIVTIVKGIPTGNAVYS